MRARSPLNAAISSRASRRTLLLAGVLALSAAGACGPHAFAAATTANGTLVINVTIYPNVTLTNGTIELDPSYYVDSPNGNATAAQALTFYGATTLVKVSGGKASATLTIPYTVFVPSSGYTLNVQLQASGQPNKILNYNAAFNASLALPANGTTTTLNFTGTL